MAVVQTITVAKPGASFTSLEEIRADIQSTMNNTSYINHMTTLRNENSMSANESFDVDTQKYTLVRTWQDAAYTTWNNDKGSESTTNQTKLKSAGYNITNNIA